MPTSVRIESSRLILRELTADDVPALRDVVDDPMARRFYVVTDPALNDMEAYVAEAMANAASVPRTMYQLGVVRRDSGELIGRTYISLTGLLGVPDLGMVISARHRGENFGTEVMQLLVRVSFESLELDAVWAMCRPDNIRAQRLCVGVGMRLVRRIKDWPRVEGEHDDSLLYVAYRDRPGWGSPGPRPGAGDALPSPRFEACRCLRPTCPCPASRHYALELRWLLRALRRQLAAPERPEVMPPARTGPSSRN